MRREIIFKNAGLLVTEHYRAYNIESNTTHFLKVDRIYLFKGIPYYITQGKGSIEIEKLPHSKPHFNLIKLENLEYFILNKTHSSLDYDEQAQIELFCDIADFNETFKSPRIYTQEYKRLEKALYGIESKDNNITIKRY